MSSSESIIINRWTAVFITACVWVALNHMKTIKCFGTVYNQVHINLQFCFVHVFILLAIYVFVILCSLCRQRIIQRLSLKIEQLAPMFQSHISRPLKR